MMFKRMTNNLGMRRMKDSGEMVKRFMSQSREMSLIKSSFDSKLLTKMSIIFG